MGRRKNQRSIHGILLLDKALGVSSNKALQEVRHLFQARKAGHTGSLDPMATGLLPICFGEATKVSHLMLDDDKAYQVTVKLGKVTDTGDAEGNIIEDNPVPELSLSILLECLAAFKGEIEQIPPMYSALKYQGRKLYELARQGIDVERKPRKITIHALELLQHEATEIRLEVVCSKGTYIRSLAQDIGVALGCGAMVTELRRIQSGQFHLKHALTIENMKDMSLGQLDDCLMNVDLPLKTMAQVILSEEQAGLIRHGQQIRYDLNNQASGPVRMYKQDHFLGLGELCLDGKLVPKKIFNLPEISEKFE